ncbi:MAG: TlpA family protein disulfide reductase [Lachnospiraceae bacterium]|nr:TlpA family protein disulfide reductase [Lachnospiraceae bacterium]
MENKKTLIIVSVLLVTLIGGASFLYAKLGDKMKPDNLLIHENQTQENETTENNIPSDANTPAPTVSVDNSGASSGNADSATMPETNDDTATEDNTPFMAPDFTVYDRKGNTVHLSDFLGKPVVLNFWASWCGPCKMEMPDFEEVYTEYKDDIHFVMINLTDGNRETIDTATTFLDNSGYTFPVYYDKDSDAALTYQVYGIPMTYFINAEGHLIAQGTSALDAETIKRGIEMILK